ncbi:MAG: ribonuclease D [Proteobacteria bacterium]|nr:ribonuclease D [Pseudomonadota bacterium]
MDDGLAQTANSSSGIYVTDAGTLRDLCAKLAGHKCIAVDTEFSRTRSYYPIMSLIQVAATGIAFAVDLLKLSRQELQPLFDILQNPKCCKVFHSGRQDIEGLYSAFSVVVANAFDTQVAMQFSGAHGQPGYEAMVRHYLNIQVAKDMQFSDWMQRPLRQEQLDYAIADVVHLLDVYPMVLSEIVQAGKLAWLQQECDGMINAAISPASCYDILRKLGLASIDEQLIARAYRLVQWREQYAVSLNLNRIFVMPDAMLGLLARKPALFPKNNTQYNKLGGRNKVPGESLRQLVQTPPELLLEATTEELTIARDVIADNRRMVKTPLFTMLKELLGTTAAEHKISEPFIASQLDLLRFASKQRTKLDHGWRHEVFGRQASSLRDASL